MTTQKASANKIYLDNAASTPIRDEVFQEMIPYLTLHYGNPSSLHAFGFEANRAINKARKHVASIIGAKPSEIIFTGERNGGRQYGHKRSSILRPRESS